MYILEVCGNLVSSIRHNRFKGHFELWMETLVSKELGDHCCRVSCVVVHEFSQGKEIDPVVLLVVDVHPKILFQDLVNTFGLTVGLGMVGC